MQGRGLHSLTTNQADITAVIGSFFLIQKRPENRQNQISNTVFKSRTSKVFMENP